MVVNEARSRALAEKDAGSAAATQGRKQTLLLSRAGRRAHGRGARPRGTAEEFPIASIERAGEMSGAIPRGNPAAHVLSEVLENAAAIQMARLPARR